MGLALFGGAILQQIGLLTTTVTNSSFLTALYVMIVPLISVVVLRSGSHWVIWPATLIAILGTFLLSGGQIQNLKLGDLLTVFCALFWAVQIVLSGVFVASTMRPFALVATQFAVCSCFSLGLGVITEPIDLSSVAASAGEILYVGIVASALAFMLQTIGQRHTSAPQAAIMLSSEAVFGALMSALFLREKLPFVA